MAGRFFTVMVMTGVSSKIKKYSVPRSIFHWLCGGGAVLFLCMAFFISSYYKMWRQLNEVVVAEPQKEVFIARVDDSKMRRLSHDISTIKRDMQNLDKAAAKFRIMVGLQENVNKDRVLGVGGTEEDSFDRVNIFRGSRLWNTMLEDIEKMEISISTQKSRMSELMGVLEDRQNLLASTPSLWPVKGWLTSHFGMRRSPFTGRREYHRGVDISAPSSTLIEAPASGIITFVGVKGALGKSVELNHGFGMVTCYGHLSKYLVREGQRVVRGEPIAHVGNTGRSTGPHLHYAIRIANVSVNPQNYMLD